jgi:hypothetical protein
VLSSEAAYGSVITAVHVVTDGSREYGLPSIPLVVVGQRSGKQQRAALFGHELEHVEQLETEIAPYDGQLATRAKIVEKCLHEADARLVEADLGEAATNYERHIGKFKRSDLGPQRTRGVADDILLWQDAVEQTGDIRYLTANMIKSGYVRFKRSFIRELPCVIKTFWSCLSNSRILGQ